MNRDKLIAALFKDGHKLAFGNRGYILDETEKFIVDYAAEQVRLIADEMDNTLSAYLTLGCSDTLARVLGELVEHAYASATKLDGHVWPDENAGVC